MTRSAIDMWPSIKYYPFSSKGIHIDASKYPICAKDEDVQCFFSYLKLISTHRVNFERAIHSFIVFSDVRHSVKRESRVKAKILCLLSLESFG